MTTRIIDASLILLALMIPFSIAGMNTAIFLGLAAWLVSSLIRRPEAGSLYRISRDPIVIASLLLALSAVPSVLMSEDTGRAFNDWKSYWLLLVYALAAANLQTTDRRQMVFWALFVSVMLSCGVALVQHLGGLDFWFIHLEHERRPGSTLYPMTLAGILYQLILLNTAVLSGRRRWSWLTAAMAAGVVIQVLVLMLTLTRGAYLALWAGTAVLLLLCRNARALLGAAVIVAVSVLFLTLKPADLDRPLTVPSIVKSPPDRNVGTRLVLWDISWELFREHPVFGVGMGDFSIEAERIIRERKIKTKVDSHNIYLQILATRGLFGFLFFSLFWWVVGRELFRLRGRRPDGSLDRQLANGALAVTAAVLTGALTENNIDDAEVYIAFLFVLGLARSSALAAPARRSANPQDRPDSRT
jgi:O-antigen ligase